MERTSGVPSLQEDGPSAKESVRGMLHDASPPGGRLWSWQDVTIVLNSPTGKKEMICQIGLFASRLYEVVTK